jgi:hypothetical protein
MLVVQKKNKELSNPNIIEIRKAAFLWVLAEVRVRRRRRRQPIRRRL